MVLVYLPTKLGDLCKAHVGKYSSTMEHMGIFCWEMGLSNFDLMVFCCEKRVIYEQSSMASFHVVGKLFQHKINQSIRFKISRRCAPFFPASKHEVLKRTDTPRDEGV